MKGLPCGTRSIVGEWLSLVEHLVRDQGVGGSNPLSPTNLVDSVDSGAPPGTWDNSRTVGRFPSSLVVEFDPRET